MIKTLRTQPTKRYRFNGMESSANPSILSFFSPRNTINLSILGLLSTQIQRLTAQRPAVGLATAFLGSFLQVVVAFGGVEVIQVGAAEGTVGYAAGGFHCWCFVSWDGFLRWMLLVLFRWAGTRWMVVSVEDC
jgi:hypothetical protein